MGKEKRCPLVLTNRGCIAEALWDRGMVSWYAKVALPGWSRFESPNQLGCKILKINKRGLEWSKLSLRFSYLRGRELQAEFFNSKLNSAQLSSAKYWILFLSKPYASSTDSSGILNRVLLILCHSNYHLWQYLQKVIFFNFSFKMSWRMLQQQQQQYWTEKDQICNNLRIIRGDKGFQISSCLYLVLIFSPFLRRQDQSSIENFFPGKKDLQTFFLASERIWHKRWKEGKKSTKVENELQQLWERLFWLSGSNW